MTIFGKKSHYMKHVIVGGIVMTVAVGCGGMMDSNTSSMQNTSKTQKGSFIDSPVKGLHFETETQTGTTDENGAFTYIEGETITFHIGGKKLGSAKAQKTMTPVHLVDGATDETDPVVTNMGMLLQSLDEDGNPDNGITITDDAADQVSQSDIDFSLDPSEFQNQDSLKKMLDTMNEKGMFTDGDHMMKTPEEAQEHMNEYMTPFLNHEAGQDMMDMEHDMMENGMNMDSMMKKKAGNTSASVQGKHGLQKHILIADSESNGDEGPDNGSGHGSHGGGGMNSGGGRGGC